MSLTAAHIAASTIQPRLESLLSGLVAGVWYGRVPTSIDVEAFAKPWVVYQLVGTPAHDFEADRIEYVLTVGVRVVETKAGANAAQLAAVAAVRSGLSRWQPSAWPSGVTGSAVMQTEDAGRGFEGSVVEDGFTFTFHAEIAAGG